MVDTSLMEAAIQQTYWQSAIYLATGENPGPTGSAHILTAPYQAFPTADGWINVGGANQANWERIAKAIGREDLLADPRFATNGDRMKHLAELTPLIAERMKARPSAHWIRELESAGVPVGPINRIGDMLADPQVAAREMVVEVDHPKAGRTKALGLPIKFSDTPASITRARRCWASTRARSSLPWATTTRRSTASPPPARWRCPDPGRALRRVTPLVTS